MTRIIAGEHRGRRLKTPPGRDRRMRPTSDRTKTVLFDLLGSMDGVETVLDLYAGTGALGIEALSRGVVRATFVERQTRAVALIRENLDRLGLSEAGEVEKTDALAFVANDGRSWDLVLADPPYEVGAAGRVLSAIDEFDILHVGGALMIEHEPGLALPDGLGTLVRTKRRTVGSTELSLYRRDEDRREAGGGRE